MNLNYKNDNVQNIYLSRHGESEYNVEDRIGGNSELSSKGKEYIPNLK